MNGMELRYLNEEQIAAFDYDGQAHTDDDLKLKLSRIGQLTQGAFTVLDIGGGNGRFLDTILDAYPQATGTLLDMSPSMITVNRPHPHKSVMIGDVGNLDRVFPPQSFDVITINWLLHHLVGSSHATCAENCRLVLRQCRSLLRPGGVIIVGENMFDGFCGTNLPSWIIYQITSIRTAWFSAVSRRCFNTAGVGVCFRSTKVWRKLFHEAGLTTIYEDQGWIWDHLTLTRKLLFPFLGIRQVSHRHFYLRSMS